MSISRIFNSGNSQAVRIPKDLQFDASTKEVEITQVGNELRITPLKKEKLNNIMEKFSAFSTDFMENGREENEQTERDSF